MEDQRDLTQIIVHVDMDAFYASVELLDDPSLADKLFAVGGGVISTASYAARKHGVRSGMAGMPRLSSLSRLISHTLTEFIARKLCPELVVLRSNFPRYTELSKQVMSIFRRYDPTMCAAGCDEGYLKYAPVGLLTRGGSDGKLIYAASQSTVKSTSLMRMSVCVRCATRSSRKRS